jgi:beta-glucosidase
MSPTAAFVLLFVLTSVGAARAQEQIPPSPRVRDLVARMTLDEKASQCVMDCPAVPRLGLRAYHWWNECLHGVGRAGAATVFPQALGLAATFDPELMRKIGEAVSAEALAKHRRGEDSPQYGGLTFWTPTINLARDPRWGRTEETYGEDPLLTSLLGTAYVRGLQGDDPLRPRVAACAKHFAVHSQELRRERKNVVVDEDELLEHYLPAFAALVREAGVAQVMTAYNAVDGEPCTGHPRLLPLLREGYGFTGVVVSDVGAPDHVHDRHRRTETYPAGAAFALRGGVDVLSPNDPAMPQWLAAEVRAGRLDERELDRALYASLGLRERLGLLDAPPPASPASPTATRVVGRPEHVALARTAAARSFVLLRNAPSRDGAPRLPLRPADGSVVVCGPFAERTEFGGYSGTPTVAPPTPFAALYAAWPAAAPKPRLLPWRRPAAASDAEPATRPTAPLFLPTPEEEDVLRSAGVVVACLGTGPEFEDENRDREDLGLPPAQDAYLRRLLELNPSVVLVTSSGGPLAVPAAAAAPAWLQIWYPGQEGPAALAEILLGSRSPSGRMPITVPTTASELPPFEDYAIAAGRTYRYFRGAVQTPFGHGLSYAEFDYEQASLVRGGPEADADVARVMVRNRSAFAAEEVVQVYGRVSRVSTPAAVYPPTAQGGGAAAATSRPARPVPKLILLGFRRVAIPAFGSVEAEVPLPRAALRVFDAVKRKLVPRFAVDEYAIGASSADLRLFLR